MSSYNFVDSLHSKDLKKDAVFLRRCVKRATISREKVYERGIFSFKIVHKWKGVGPRGRPPCVNLLSRILLVY